ncbi:MAG: hypothetical protein EON93_14365 [Burkholderiales bacterium]|nr:MAG: hypothetical protein EON93_14365 [Burkholderiales bacterium]
MKITIKINRQMSKEEFGIFQGTPAYFRALKHRVSIPPPDNTYTSDEEFKRCAGMIEDWLDENATNLFHVMVRYNGGSHMRRIDVICVEPNDVFNLKLSLDGSESDPNGMF